MAFSPDDYSDWSLRGEGGEAEIFRARQISLDRLVAIKRLKLTSIGDANDIFRFEREAKLCASLIHPNLVPIFEYGSEGKYYYLVMEFVHGVDLGKISDLPVPSVNSTSLDGLVGFSRAAKPTLPDSLKVHLARQMVEVVDFIQMKGILHRDLKPENFMADSTARIKLLDLGMAITQYQSPVHPQKGGLKGSLAYIPPELLRGQGHLGKVSEQYSLALVLLELFQGSRYYLGKSSDQVIGFIQAGIPWEEMEGVPALVKPLLAPYLNSDAGKRPKTLEPLLRGLKSMQGNTLAIAGGREALHVVIHREQRAWLWAMVNALEANGRIDEAFTRLRELLEVDPDDVEAQSKFQEMSIQLNNQPEPIISNPAGSASLLPTGSAAFKNRSFQIQSWAFAGVLLFGLGIGALFYFQNRTKSGDMGRDLMVREMTQLAKDGESLGVAKTKLPSTKSPLPSLRPYGVLVVSSLPKGYRLLINGVHQPIEGEIHLPVSRHLLEIQNAANHIVLRDSISIGGGEPAVFNYQKRVGKL